MTTTHSDATLDAARQEVFAVLDAVYAAWADNDADAFVAPYLDDATVVMPGVYRTSREEVRQQMAMGFAGPLRDSRVLEGDRDIRLLGDDIALVAGQAGILFSGEDEVPAERLVCATWVFVKRDGRWLIAAYGNAPVHQPG